MTSSPPNSPFHWQYTELDDHNFRIQGRTLFYVVILFALVLLFSLLFFYARWLFRCLDYPGPLALPPPPTWSEHGLGKPAIDALPIVLHQVGRGEEEIECSICLGVLEEGEKVKVLPLCEHRFHGECVDRWLTSRSVCPLCRAKVGFSSLELEVVIRASFAVGFNHNRREGKNRVAMRAKWKKKRMRRLKRKRRKMRQRSK